MFLPAGRKFNLPLFILFLLFFLLRGMSIFVWSPMEGAIVSDMLGYWNKGWFLAQGSLTQHTYGQGIGFPALIALSILFSSELFLLKVLHLLFSCATLIVLFFKTRANLGPHAAYALLVLLGLHASIIGLDSHLLAETSFQFILLVAFCFIDIKKERIFNFFFTGILLGVSTLFKGLAVAAIPILIAFLFLKKRPNGAVALAFGVCLIFLANSLLGYFYTGQFQGSSGGAAINFVEGKCPTKKIFDPNGWVLSPLHFSLGETQEKHYSEPFSNSIFYWKVGFECIKTNPVVLVTSFRYWYYLFFDNPVFPLAESTGWHQISRISFHLIGLLIIGGLLCLLFFERPYFLPSITDSYFVSLLLGLLFTTWILKSEARYRVPFDPLFLYWAMGGWKRASEWVQRKIILKFS